MLEKCLNLNVEKVSEPSVFMLYIPLISFFCSCFAVVDDWEDTTMFSYFDSRDKTAVMAKRMKYFTNNGKKKYFLAVVLFHFQRHNDLQQ